MNTKKKILVILFIGLFTTVFAHGIWVEIINKGAVGKEAKVHLYFGEINHNLKEKGLKWYDGEMFKNFIALVKSQGSKTAQPLTLSPSETSLSAKFTPKTVGIYQIVAFNEDSPVRDLTKYGLGIIKDSTYLRTTFEATAYRKKQEGKIDYTPLMQYDIVPFPAKNGYGDYDSHKSIWRIKEKVYATFYIDYKPAENKEIKISSPDGWYVIKKTNEKGEFNFTPYKKGVYQALYKKENKTKGTFKGKKYDSSRIKSTALLIVE